MTASCTSVVNLANVTPIACPNSFDLLNAACNTKQDLFHSLSNILSNGHKQVSETKKPFHEMSQNIYGALRERRKNFFRSS